MPSFSDLKSVNSSFGVTWSKRGVSALYICAWASAFGPGTPYCPDGRMFRAMIVGSAAVAAGGNARNADAITPIATHKRVPRISLSPLGALANSAAGTLLDGAKGREPSGAQHLDVVDV